MATDQAELKKMGQLIYPQIAEFADVIAVYHRGEDIIFKISPKIPADIWIEAAKKVCLEKGFWLQYMHQKGMHLLVAKDIRPKKARTPWLNILLAALTIVSMTITYAFFEHGTMVLEDLSLIWSGVSFMASLMCILTFHEFGHYFAGKKHKADVSLPYFIPAPYPVTIFGTLGAFIKSRSPFKNRTELFDVGVAGPLAGFIPAVIILIYGLATAGFEATSVGEGAGAYVIFGDSLILLILQNLVTPPIPEGHHIALNQFIYAGWVGLFVTMMNLLPMGQLDGGHIVYALVGKRMHKYIANTVLIILLALGFVWTGWIFWAALVTFIIKVKHPPTMDDDSPLDKRRKIVGWIAIAIFLLTFVPMPFKVEGL